MLTLENIDRFISAQTCGLQTKYFMLCHMARLLSWAGGLLRGYEIEMARLKKRREGLLKQVRRLKVKHSDKGKLSPAQIAALLTAWDGERSYIGVAERRAHSPDGVYRLAPLGIGGAALAGCLPDQRGVRHKGGEGQGRGGAGGAGLRSIAAHAGIDGGPAADAVVGRAPLHLHRRWPRPAYTREPGGEHSEPDGGAGARGGESRCRT